MLFNVMIIVFGVALASFGEIRFVWLGFFYQAGGIVFEAIRLIMIQMLLSGEGQNMDPLVSLYYYAPVCAVMNFLVAAATEMSSFQMADVWRVGVVLLLLNAAVAFLLNVASVFLVCAPPNAATPDAYTLQIGRTSGLVMTLCGVLKNILLVVASVVFWGTIITGLQIVGYGIALVGLVYYGVGYDGILTYYAYSRAYAMKLWEGRNDTATTQRPTLLRKALVISLYTTVVVLLVTGFAIHNGKASEYIQSLTDRLDYNW